MKIKKLISIILAATVITACFGAVPALAAKYKKGDFFINGDMELLGTAFAKWTGYTVEKEIVHSGEKAARVETTDTSRKLTLLHRNVEWLIENESYTFSAFVYINELAPEGKVGLKLEFRDAKGNMTKQVGPIYTEGIPEGKWAEISIEDIAPAGTVAADLHVRLDNGGSVIFDDVTFSGPMTEETLDFQTVLKDRYYVSNEISQSLLDAENAKNDAAVILEGYPNTVPNPGFEEAEGVKAIGWECLSNAWGTTATVTNEEAHSGNNSLKIASTSSSATTWARAYVDIEDGCILPGEDHVLSAWVKYKSVEPNKGAFMKMEPNASMPGAGEQASGNYLFDDNEWHKINFVFNVNTLTTRIGLLIRLRGAGEIYYDDITFGPVASTAEPMELDSDTFFYTEHGTGTAKAMIDNSKVPIPEGAYVEFAIKDGNTVLVSETVPAKRNTIWEFDVMTMAEMKRPYTLQATYKAADGTIISETKTNEIYRYNRPGALAADGTYMKDGKPFHPYIAYETIEDYMPLAKEIGINVMRSFNRPVAFARNADNLRGMLDDALEKGYLVAVALYGSVPAGHAIIVDTTQDLVREFKDHPAVFAWMIMDEPSLNAGTDNMVKTYDEMVHWLKESYIAIREIDDYHPVYVLDTQGQVKNPELYSSRNGDVFVTDPYPGNEARIPDRVSERTEVAVETVNPTKPVYIIQTTYEMYKPAELYEDSNIARHQLYQAALAGARGFGLYGLTFESDLDNPTGARDMYTNKTVWEGYKQIKESGELAEIVDHFFDKNSPKYNESLTTKDYHYYSWLKDGEIYMVVRNMSLEPVTAEIDLASYNGKVKPEGFTTAVINGDAKEISSEGSVFTVNLEKFQTILYKIKPNNELDVNALALPKYDDLGTVDWAKDAIELLGQLGIVNDTGANAFSPERNITRGEFAYFLMNTLEIDNTSGTQQFSDVDPNAFYADAILAGRKAGILLGSGGGVYNPEEGISRQDAMTICARALKQQSKIGVADSTRILGGFTDNGIIADYAAEHIASMVDEGIVKGNPDGTVNPLGNITRAEAAVIMNRILNLY